MAKELDFGGVRGLIKDVLTTQILSRISGFSEEVEGFEARYGKDYLFIDGKRKYSYHWQDKSGILLSRWDNAPQYSDVISFPHHRHLENTEVTASTERNLPEIFLVVRKALKNNS